MMALPDSPDIAHLRRQAKDLLAGMRDTAPTTTLAQAQTALAQQYGFRTWPDLKSEVERRREDGAGAEPAVAEAIAARYGLGTVRGAMRSVRRRDDVGRRWCLETDRGRWAVSSVEDWRPIVPAERDVELQEAAAAAGVPLPMPVRSVDGEVVEEIDGAPWRVTEWRHSGPPLTAPVGAADARTAGRVLAAIHGLGLSVDRISPWHAGRLSDEPWPGVAARVRAAGVPWAGAVDRALRTLEDLDAVGAGATAGTPVLTHNTFGPAKARRTRGGDLVVLGWEHAGGQPPDWELADLLVHWTVGPDDVVNAAGARALLEGYGERAGHLPPLDADSFRGAATSLTNYAHDEIATALEAARGTTAGSPDREATASYTARSVTHLLTHLPTRAAFGRLLEVVVAVH